MSKFQRNYRLVYTFPNDDGSIESLEVKYPITCEFDITRNTFAQSNTATFRLYNLSLTNRNKMYQDVYNINRYCFVDFYAGYGENLKLLFTGKVLTAMSDRVDTDMITTIEALDNDIIQSYSSHTFEAGTSKSDVIKTLAGDMPNVQLGAIGSVEGQLSEQLVVDGKTFIEINKITGNQTFIDLNKVHTLNNNEVLGDTGIYQISSDTGLLGTPKRRDSQIEVEAIFTPEVTVAQLVEIKSVTAAQQYNGQYKVVGIRHSGVISGAICGEVKTILNLFVGAFLPNSNFIFTGVSNAPLSSVKGDAVSPISTEAAGTIRQVRAYIVKNGAPPTTKITSGIRWSDVIRNYSKQGEVPSLSVLSNLYTTAQRVQRFVDKFYPGSTINVTSGWRSKSYNATVPGSSPTSSHTRGMAIDFSIKGQVLYYVYKYFAKFWSGRRYLGSGFIHCDISVGGGKIANDA